MTRKGMNTPSGSVKVSVRLDQIGSHWIHCDAHLDSWKLILPPPLPIFKRQGIITKYSMVPLTLAAAIDARCVHSLILVLEEHFSIKVMVGRMMKRRTIEFPLRTLLFKVTGCLKVLDAP